MTKHFKGWDKKGFAEAINSYPWKRKITMIHLHHTWIPAHKHYKGEKTIIGMWRVHTRQNHWSDIGQHLSIGPDGIIWEGRNWNKKPVSSRGRGNNGTNRRGPFSIEMIGNFDKGHDILKGKQLDSVIFACAFLQKHLGLPTRALKFHREMDRRKSCPGTSIKKSVILKLIDDYKKKL